MRQIPKGALIRCTNVCGFGSQNKPPPTPPEEGRRAPSLMVKEDLQNGVLCMAIYHFSVKMISRNKGRSSTAAAAYRAGIEITDERTGEVFDYTRKKGMLGHAILAPSRAPDWAKSPQSLWNAAEKAEKRKDAQVCRENTVALPHELTLEQNINLLHGFVQEAYIKRGMVAQVDIHGPDRKGDNRNIHAHIMLTTRQITRNGFKDKKPRNWNERSQLKEWRELWADHVNRALEREGKKERVDSRSFKDQGIDDKIPTRHLGPAGTAIERNKKDSRIAKENRDIEHWNRDLAEMEQDLKVIDFAIQREEKRLKSEKEITREKPKTGAAKKWMEDRKNRYQEIKDAKQRTKIREENAAHRLNSLHLKQLDEKRALEQWGGRKLDKARETVKQTYNRKGAITDLQNAEKDLSRRQGLFNRLTGRTEKAEEKVWQLKKNLSSIQTREQEWMQRIEKRVLVRQEALTERHKNENSLLENEFSKAREPDREDTHAKDSRIRELFKQKAQEKKQARKDKDRERDAGRSRNRGREPGPD
jgi:MobA/MobL family